MKLSFHTFVQRLGMAALMIVGLSHLVLAQKIAIVDAGSSGSRLNIYEIKDSAEYKLIKLVFPIPGKDKDYKGRALSGIANHPDSVKAYIDQMAAKYTPEEPMDMYVLATAGMRLRNKEKADSIYSLMMYKSANGYTVKNAMTISGSYEGLYAWIAANYENHRIAFTPLMTAIDASIPTYGIVEVGGASMQITFVPNAPCNESLSRPGFPVIYSRSYLGGGVDQVFLHTVKQQPYYFTVPFEDVSSLFTQGQKFYGLGTPLELLLKDKKDLTFDAYLKMVSDNDATDKYHSYFNAHYMTWMSRYLKIDACLLQAPRPSTWTQGAALDILVNGNQPL